MTNPSLFADDAVGRRIGEDNPRPELLGIFEIHQGVRRDNNHVADLHLTSCSAIQTDTSAVARPLDNIGLETLAVVDVQNLDRKSVV